MNEPDRSDRNYDSLEIRPLFHKLSDTCAKFSSPSEHLPVEEVTRFEVYMAVKTHCHVGCDTM